MQELDLLISLAEEQMGVCGLRSVKEFSEGHTELMIGVRRCEVLLREWEEKGLEE